MKPLFPWLPAPTHTEYAHWPLLPNRGCLSLRSCWRLAFYEPLAAMAATPLGPRLAPQASQLPNHGLPGCSPRLVTWVAQSTQWIRPSLVFQSWASLAQVTFTSAPTWTAPSTLASPLIYPRILPRCGSFPIPHGHFPSSNTSP